VLVGALPRVPSVDTYEPSAAIQEPSDAGHYDGSHQQRDQQRDRDKRHKGRGSIKPGGKPGNLPGSQSPD